MQDLVEVRIRNARLEGELAGVKAALDAEKRRADELRERADELGRDRDRWAAQAERLTLAGPHVPQQQQPHRGRGWLSRLFHNRGAD